MVIVELEIRVSNDLRNLVREGEPQPTPTLGREQALNKKQPNVESTIAKYYIVIFTSIAVLLLAALALPVYTIVANPSVLFKNKLIVIISYIVAVLFLVLTILLCIAVTVLIKTLSASTFFASMFSNEIKTLRNILIAFCSSYTLRLLLDFTLAPIWLN